MLLIVWAVRLRLRFRRKNLNSQRYREIGADNCRFAWLQIWEEGRRRTVNFAASPFHYFAITVIRESVNHKRSDLTQNFFCDVARALGCQANVQTVFTPLFGN